MPKSESSESKGQSWGSCFDCVHLGPQMTCPAFPQRIPIAIASGEIDHLTVHPGQVGDTVFEPIDKEVWRTTRRRVPARTGAMG
jgi:hypothetical protein